MSTLGVWRTLFTNDFDTKKYLYHYTNFESALKILNTNTMLFSKIDNTNDPSEAKTKVIFSPNEVDYRECEKKIKIITDYFMEYNSSVQLLCLSMDMQLTEETKQEIISNMNHKDIFYNISGRGFALPRMWAQYGGNNKGVCFIVNKEKLLHLVLEHTAISKYYPVKYTPFYDGYVMTAKKMEILIKKISVLSNGRLALLKLFEEDDEFLKYNFFEKNENWKNENEFRILTFIDEAANASRCKIPNFRSCLEGIVLGEQIDETNEKVFRVFAGSIGLEIDIKRITFNNRLYKLV